ncbi:PAS domain-containing protein [Dongia deserti]|uniref:PAS domain-containing protein n=1 Tax=Dongia deserti TaxID=2268030 RepID=UPI000E658EBD|nr:PAS domain-containing protein [Dongia deserti]
MGDLGGIKLIQASELSSEIVRAAVDYWQSKRTDNAPPDRDSFDPLEVPRLLPYLMWKDVRRDPWDFRYRVVGTTVREHSRHNWTGKWMSEVEGQGEGSRVFSVMRWVSEQGKVAIFRPPYVGPHKEFKYCEAAVMPWRGSASLVDRVLVAVDFLTD